MMLNASKATVRSFPAKSSQAEILKRVFRMHTFWEVIRYGKSDSPSVLGQRTVGDLSLTYVDLPPLEAFRPVDQGEVASVKRYAFIYIVEGAHVFGQENHRVEVVAGDTLVWDLTKPAFFSSKERFKAFFVFVPTEKVIFAAPGVFSVIGKNINPKMGGSDFLSTHLQSLYELLFVRQLSVEDTFIVESIQYALALINALCSCKSASKDTEVILRINDYIRTNFSDDQLTPITIAKKFGISVPNLYRLYQQEGITLAKRIRNWRLQKSREILESGRYKELTITDICLKCGFKDASHFTRLFSKKFGVSPSSLRKKILEGAHAKNINQRVEWGE